MDSRLQPQRPPPHRDGRRQQGLEPYLTTQNRGPRLQDQLPPRREGYGAGYRSVANDPPSPIAFAARDPYPSASTNDVSHLPPNAPPQRERADTQPHSRQHAFLDGQPQGSFPAKSHPNDSGAKSTFSADEEHSVSNRSRTSSGGKKILKRMMKELAGGPKEPTPQLDGNPLSPKKEKVMAYGRGGAGRVKKKPSATLAEKSKSTTSIASSDDMKTLKSASSSAATKTGKVVYDPYLKTMVGTRGITLPPAANPTVTTTIPPLPNSAHSSTPQSPASSAPYSSNFTSVSGSSRTGPSTAGSIARPPSSRSGWDDESIVSDAWPSGRSRDHYPTPPPSAFSYNSSRVDPQGYPSPPPSEGRAPSAWKSHGIQRRPSDLSLRAGAATPSLDPTQLLIHSLLQQQPVQTAGALPVPPPQPTVTPDLATTLYAALLAQQTAIPPPAPSIQQPIIPPLLANNLDSIIAAAAAYSQLLAAATGTAAAPLPQEPPKAPNPPVAIPIHPSGKNKDDVAALNNALASYNISNPSTAASSPSSVSALSPPPRHQQLRKGNSSGSNGPTPPRRSSSPHAAPEEPKKLAVDERTRPRKKRSFQNLVTPPATDDGRSTTLSSSLTVDGNADLLASNVSFSSSLTPSPAPSTLTVVDAPPPGMVQPLRNGRAPQDESFYRPAPAATLTPSASSSTLSNASNLLDAPVNAPGRNRSNTTSQESFSSTRSNVSDKDGVSKAEKELLKLEKSLQSFRTLSTENMQKQYSAPRAPSRAAEAPRGDVPVIASADRSRVLPPPKQPPPSSAGAALSVSANNNNAAARRPRKPSVTEMDEEYYRRMHMALPPLPSAPSPISHANPPRRDSSTTSSSSQSQFQRTPAAPSPNFSTRPLQTGPENPVSSYGRQAAAPSRGGPSAEALASRQPNAWRSNNAAELLSSPNARSSVMSATLTEMDFPMPPTSITVRPGAGGMVRPAPRKDSLMASSNARPRPDYI